MDKTPPLSGTVHDGLGMTDLDYTSENNKLSASWHGFSDTESFIDHYTVCAGTEPSQQNVVDCQDVGLATKYTLYPEIQLNAGYLILFV